MLTLMSLAGAKLKYCFNAAYARFDERVGLYEARLLPQCGHSPRVWKRIQALQSTVVVVCPNARQRIPPPDPGNNSPSRRALRRDIFKQCLLQCWPLWTTNTIMWARENEPSPYVQPSRLGEEVQRESPLYPLGPTPTVPVVKPAPTAERRSCLECSENRRETVPACDRSAPPGLRLRPLNARLP